MSGVMNMLLGARTTIAAAVDAFFNQVTLLLPGDGTNGAQNNTFLDSSTNNFTNWESLLPNCTWLGEMLHDVLVDSHSCERREEV